MAGTLVVNSTQALGLGNLVVNGGVLRADPQPINVKGNYTQSAGGTLQLSLGGSAPGQYDLLDVSGAVALNGTLQLFTRNGFQPAIGEKLTIVLGAAGVSGQFAQVLEPFGPLIGLEVVYLSNSVLLEFGRTLRHLRGRLTSGRWRQKSTVQRSIGVKQRYFPFCKASRSGNWMQTLTRFRRKA